MSRANTVLETPLTSLDHVELTPLPPLNAAQESETPTVTQNKDSLKRDWRLLFRFISCGVSFFVAGVNDGSLGALLPYVIRSYGLTTAIASSVYAANFLGWLTSALVNTHLSQHLDLGALLALGAALQIAAQALRAWTTPFPLFVATFWLTSVGQAFQDTHANSYVAGASKGAHNLLGFIHACYMAGCLLAPFAASPVAAAREPSVWYLSYAVSAGLGVVNLLMCVVAFRDSVGMKSSGPRSAGDDASMSEDEPRRQAATRLLQKTLKQSSLWYISVFFFFYLGMTLTASGWVVEYLVDVRDGDLDRVSYVPAGFSGGCLLGRLLLPEPTHRYGERLMGTIYLVICLGVQLVFWFRVPNIIAASIAISVFGFFSGPLFAAAMSVGSRLFPSETRSTALALVFVFAQMGGSLFPIVTGLLSTSVGVWVLQPMLVSLIAVTIVTWFIIPKPKDSQNDELHQE
ncbi:hypothetical protein WHR41_07753 [Cladosporium halotolerans]|uniref:Major facilitator superfamily (MFS) profile domain-containing protein n=1 Tax=Cladosporium halotolerans TaxID=1052096 RepID=A0AB34KI65_9PEZI